MKRRCSAFDRRVAWKLFVCALGFAVIVTGARGSAFTRPAGPFSVLEYGPAGDGHEQVSLGAHSLDIAGTIALTTDGAVWVHDTLAWHPRFVRYAKTDGVRDFRYVGDPLGGASGAAQFSFAAVAVRGSHLLVAMSRTSAVAGVHVTDFGPDGTETDARVDRCLAAGPDLLCGLPATQLAPCAAEATSALIAPDGNLWFTDSETKSRIGRVTPGGACTFFQHGLTKWDSGPELITLGPDGNMWFTEVRNRIGRVTPDGTIAEFPIAPRDRPFLGGIASGPDGALWFTVYHGNDLGRMTTDGRWKIYRGITYPSRYDDDNPVSMFAKDAQGRLYTNLSQAGRFARITIGK